MNVTQPAAQRAAHDIASGLNGSIRPQQTPRRLSIADFAELAARSVQAVQPSSPTAASQGPQPEQNAPAAEQAAPVRRDARPVRPGSFLDIRV